MATTVTGTNVSNWEAYFKYALTNVDGGSYKVTMNDSGIHNLNKYDFAISSGIKTTSYIGSTTKSASGGFTSSGQSDTYKDIVGSWNHTIKKTHSSQKVTLKAVTVNSSGFQNGTSTASTTITVPARTSYKVSYNANGGSGAPSSQTKWYDEDLTLSSTKPTRTGYTFKGWATSSTATSASKQPSEKYGSNASVTYYAVWQANTYAVKYDGNGGTAPDDTSRTYGQSFTLSATIPTRERHKFTGWLCNGTVFEAGATVTSMGTTAADLTFVAQWELDQYTVTFDPNGAEGSMDAAVVQYGDAYAVPECSFTRKFHKFAGWFDTAGNQITGYAGDYRGGNVTLYARWTQVYFPPSFGNVVAERCNSESVLQDDGRCALITGSFSVTGSVVTDSTGTEYDGTNPTVVAAITIGGETKSAEAAISGSSFAVMLNIGGDGFDTDMAYSIGLAVADGYTAQEANASLRGTATVTLPKAQFTMDFAAGGKGIGVGCPSPAEGFKVAFASMFEGAVSGSGFLDFIWPIGSIYQTTDTEFNPNEAWGGTWERIEDRFLLAANDTTRTAGATKDGETVTLSAENLPSHSHTMSHTHTMAHTHGPSNSVNRFLTFNYGEVSAGVSERAVAKATSGNYMAPVVNNANVDWVSATATGGSSAANTGGSSAANTGAVGSGTAIDIMPPYVAVNVWKRTA